MIQHDRIKVSHWIMVGPLQNSTTQDQKKNPKASKLSWEPESPSQHKVTNNTCKKSFPTPLTGVV